MKNRAVIIVLLIVISNNLKAQIDVVKKADSTTIVPDGNTKANIKVAAAYFDCLFKTHDFATMAKIIAKDAVYTQAEGLPYGGTYVGFSEWVKMFTRPKLFLIYRSLTIRFFLQAQKKVQ